MWRDTPNITTPPMGHAIAPGSTMRVVPFPGKTFGATITGVDLGSLKPEEEKAIKHEYNTRGVLCFPDQNITPAQEVAFSRLFPFSRTCSDRKLCGKCMLFFHG